MAFSRSRAFTVSAIAIAAMLMAGAPPAASQNLFEMLFKGGRRTTEPAQPAEPQPVQRAAPPRVRGPQYYTYKTDPLVKVDFASITLPAIDDAAVAPAPTDPAPVGSTIPEAPAQEANSAMVATARTLGPIPLVQDAQTLPPSWDGAPSAAQAEPAPGSADILSGEQVAALQDVTLLAEKQAAEAIVAHYSADPGMIWVEDGAPSKAARQVLRVMGEAEGHGLDPHDYAVTVPSQPDEASMAVFEMELSVRALRYARDALRGRIDPNRISGYHDFALKEFDAAGVLARLRDAPDAGLVLMDQHPKNAQYKALRADLEVLRASAENDIVIAPGTVIKPGQTNAEFPKILALIDQRADEAFRAAHGQAMAQHAGSETYAQALVPVVKAAQEMVGAGADGVIGPRTIQKLAGLSKTARIEKVLVSLERLRWLPSDLPDRHVFINTPAFEASYVEGGEEKLSMRTVVGGLSTQTYFFQDEIEYVEFHPYWGVPRSILVNKYLPKLYSDPSYLDRNGFEVVNRNGQTVSSSSVNWGAYGANIPFDVRQKPGSGNALGEMKIMFPNKHAIYMHDTPEKHLFERENRALSNGCVRLADPRAMAAAVLGWSRDRVASRLGGQHGRENLSTKVPVYVAYFTAWPDGAGKVEYFNDVYSRDDKIRAALEKVEALRAPGA